MGFASGSASVSGIEFRLMPAIYALLIGVILGLSLLSWQQYKLWYPARRDAHHILASEQRSAYLRAAFFAYEGDRLLREGDIDRAMGSYRQALAIYPAYAGVHNNMGAIYIRRGMLDDAAREYRRAIETSANFDLPHKNLADVLARKGQTEEAIAEYRAALRINPQYAGARENLDLLLSRLGRAR